MSRCLNEARIRAAADGEATEIEQRHVEGCAECSARVTAADGAGREFGCDGVAGGTAGESDDPRRARTGG